MLFTRLKKRSQFRADIFEFFQSHSRRETWFGKLCNLALWFVFIVLMRLRTGANTLRAWKNWVFYASRAKLLVEHAYPWDLALSKANDGARGILIVAELSIPQCKRYRVDHKVEILKSLGFSVAVVSFTDYWACHSALQFCQAVIFYRVPAWDPVRRLIKEAKRLRIPTLFDIDDLVFDVGLYSQHSGLADLPGKVRRELLAGAALYGEALGLCDATIASTAELQKHMLRHNSGPSILLENAIDPVFFELAAALAPRVRSNEWITIGYGSGTSTHNRDFELVAAALERVLAQFANVRLWIIGYLNLPPALTPYGDRITFLPFLPFAEYLTAIAQFSINIAPLEESTFNDAKSNIKFLEAAMFKIPTVASHCAEFTKVIVSGKTGMIARTEDEWFEAFAKLIKDPELRKNIGEQAYLAATSYYTFEHSAKRIGGMLRDIIKAPVVAPLSPKANKKVLVVNVFFSPFSFGGATIVAQDQAYHLKSMGWDVSVVTSLQWNIPDHNLSVYENAGLKIYAIRTCQDIDHSRMFSDEKIQTIFDRIVEAENPQVVLMHSIQGLGAAIIDSCRQRGIPYAVLVHDAWWICQRQFLYTAEKTFCGQRHIDLSVCAKCTHEPGYTNSRYSYLIDRLKGAAAIIAPSTYQAELYRANLRHPGITIIKNGISLPGPEYRKKPVDPNNIKIAFVGGLYANHKGFQVLMDAIVALKTANFTLVLVDINQKISQQPTPVKIPKSIRRQVMIVGPYTEETKDDFFSGVDIICAPSILPESFGLVVREALSRRVWPIATNLGAAAEDIEDGVNGSIILPNDRGALIFALETLLNAPDILIKNQGDANLPTTKQNALALDQLLSEIVQERPGIAR